MKKKIIAVILLVLVLLTIFSTVYAKTNINNDYITAKIVSINNVSTDSSQDKNIVSSKIQYITAVIEEGLHKGEKIQLKNTVNESLVVDTDYNVNNNIIVSIQENSSGKITSASIVEYKRDKFILYFAVIFAILLILVGGIKGGKSLLSLVVNIVFFYVTIKLILDGVNPILATSLMSIVFIALSLYIVGGANKKTASAAMGTVLGTTASILITIIVMAIANMKGIGYEEGEMLANLPQSAHFTFQQILLAEILIGNLGAIMDIAISIASSIHEIYEQNAFIKKKQLISSAMEIGKDIMGTMSNTLVFAYISGTIPLIVIMLNYGFSFADVTNRNLVTEMIRALSGSIGIVLSIPITTFIAIFFLKNQHAKED